jgi:hypothetical protein
MDSQTTDARRADAVRRAIAEARARRGQRGDMSPQRGQRGDMSATPAERATQEAVRRAVEGASRAVEQAARSQAGQRGQRGQQRQQGQQGRQQRQQGQQGQQAQQARQRSQSPQRGQSFEEADQYGGWGKGGSKTASLSTRLTSRAGNAETADSVKRKRVKGVLTDEISVNAHRSFRAKVDGVDLVGDSKSGEPSARYFHGDPQAAAKKVVAILHKGQSKGLKGSKNVLGQSNAVKIELMEVTKGVSKANVSKAKKAADKDAAKFSHSYYGWREPTSPKTVTSKTITDPKTGAPLVRTFAFRNRAIPIRKEGGAELSLSQSLAKSNSIGQKIKASK